MVAAGVVMTVVCLFLSQMVNGMTLKGVGVLSRDGVNAAADNDVAWR